MKYENVYRKYRKVQRDREIIKGILAKAGYANNGLAHRLV